MLHLIAKNLKIKAEVYTSVFIFMSEELQAFCDLYPKIFKREQGLMPQQSPILLYYFKYFLNLFTSSESSLE